MAKKVNKTTDKVIKKFFDLLGINTEYEISEDEEAITITLKTEDTGIVIGYHGETLEALQLVLSLVLAGENKEFKRVSLEVGDYKKNRSEWLKNLALSAKERALSEGRDVQLSDLKAWERRVIHLLLQDDKEVVSESIGEGQDRILVVRPK